MPPKEVFIGVYRLALPFWNSQNICFLLISMIFHQSQQILQDTHKCKLSFVCKNFFTKIVFSQKKFLCLIKVPWGVFWSI